MLLNHLYSVREFYWVSFLSTPPLKIESDNLRTNLLPLISHHEIPAWWSIPIIPAIKRPRWESCKVTTSGSYTGGPTSKQTKQLKSRQVHGVHWKVQLLKAEAGRSLEPKRSMPGIKVRPLHLKPTKAKAQTGCMG